MPPVRSSSSLVLMLFARPGLLCSLPSRVACRTYASADSKSSSISASDLENFRDISKRLPGIKKGLVFRSAGLETSRQDAVRQLGTRFGIKNIIDLRHKSEEGKARQRHGVTESDAVPGANYHYMDIRGQAYMKNLMRQLSMMQSLRFAFNVLMNRPHVTRKLIAEAVLTRKGLIGIATNELEHSGKEIRDTFALLADPQTYPAVIQCSYGKDRTGLIIVLLLNILSAPQHHILADYCESDRGLQRILREKILEDQRELGLPDEFAEAPQSWVTGVMQTLENGYGGARKYLDSIGVDEAMRQKIRVNLLMNPDKQLN